LLCVDPFYEKPLPYLREKSRGKGGGSPRYFLPSLKGGAGGGLTLAVKQNRTSQKLPYFSGAFKAFLLPVPYLFKASHFWLATVQLVLQADWHDVWHLPQPPLAAVSLRLALLTVLMCFIKTPPFMLSF